ncbi:MAG: phage major capsid protein [Candidatus Auribacterota bacterium]|nr:phage major capsid protein [Candidatus Auribacterota bacterium]
MSLLDQLEVITDDYILSNTPEDIIFQDNVLLYMLMAGKKFQETLVQPGETVDGGKKLKTFLEYAKSHTGTYGNTTKIPQSKKDILNAAFFRWAGYYSANTIDLDEQIQNNGKAALIDLVHSKLGNIHKTIRDKMGDDVYATATNSTAFLGLGDLFQSTDTTIAYGEVAENDMADWKANFDDTSEAISFKVMQEIRRTAKIGQSRDAKPNIYITTDALKDGFERTLHVNVRYSAGGLAKAGFDNVLFGGVPIVADDKQASGYMDALNLKYLKAKTHTKWPFTKPKWEYSKDQPDTLTANTRWIGQIVCSNRKAHARHINLTEPV